MPSLEEHWYLPILVISDSGLDPAQPYFQDTPAEVRLDPLDALFVDVIHTDSSSTAANLGESLVLFTLYCRWFQCVRVTVVMECIRLCSNFFSMNVHTVWGQFPL